MALTAQPTAPAAVSGTSVSVERRRGRGPGSPRWTRTLLTGLAFIAPTFVVLGYFMYYPAYVALLGSFTDWDGFNAPTFVGLQNFATAFADPDLRAAAYNNVLWAAGSIALAVIPPFIVAELVHSVRSGRWQYLYRTLFVVPLVVPGIVTILTWTFFYRTDGLVNQVLGAVGLDALQRGWLVDQSTALGALIFMGFPWVVPFNLLIFYAGLQSIPQEIRDAAALDGAAGLQRVLRIDIPLVLTQASLLITLAVIGSVQAILEPLIMTGGGPGNSTLTPILFMYRSGVSNGEFGYSMAISLVLFVVVLILSIFSNRLLRARY